MSLENRVLQVLERISLSAQKSGRSPQDVGLVAVSKGQSHSTVREAHAMGVHHFGENYIQEYRSKAKSLEDLKIKWHFIGVLQSKKIKDIVGHFTLIHSVDRIKLIDEIDKRSVDKNQVQKILLQINFSKEDSKSGFLEDEAPEVLERIQNYKGIQVCGLMLMPKVVGDGELNRYIFSRAKNCAITWERYLSSGHYLSELSMGTSQDFEVAIEEGATLVRVGSCLLGPRIITRKEF